MGERRSITNVILGLLFLAVVSGLLVWLASAWTIPQVRDSVPVQASAAPAGEYVAHVYGSSGLRDFGQWRLDGDTCVASFAAARQTYSGAPGLTLPLNAAGASYPYLASSHGAVSLAVPNGVEVWGTADFVVSKRTADWPSLPPDAQQDAVAFRQYHPSSDSRDGRATLSLDGETRIGLPWADAIAGARRQVALTVYAGPLDRCDRLDARWERNYTMDVQTVAATGNAPPVDMERLLPACTQSGNILEYVGPGGGSEPYDYECEEPTAGGGGLAHLTFDGYELIAAASSPSPTAGQIQGQIGDPTGITVTYTSAHAADAAKILVGNRVRITQTTGATPRWYEGTVTKIARATDTYTYHFDASDDEDNDAVPDASTLLLPASAGYEVIRIGSGLDYARTTAPLTGNGKPGNAIGISDATTTASGAMSAAGQGQAGHRRGRGRAQPR